MEMVVDLHATKVDQNGALETGLLEDGKRIVGAGCEDGLTFNVERPGLERALLARFGEPHGV